MGRRAIVLLVALILAGLAAWAVWNYLQSVEEDVRAGQTVVTVFRAGPGGIAEGADGSVLISGYQATARCRDPETTPDAATGCPLRISTDLAGNVPVGHIDSEDKLRQVLSGRVAAGPLAAGSILTETGWVAITAIAKPLSDQIPSGKQALTISTGSIQGVNGFIRAGDRLNMIITISILFSDIPVGQQIPTLPGEGEPEAETEDVTVVYTRYVLQGIPVLAVGQDIRAEVTEDQTGQVPATPPGEEAAAAAPPTIFTLEVTPEQAERIVYAFENGSIWLTLVPPDFVEVETNGVIIENLFGGDLVEQIFGN